MSKEVNKSGWKKYWSLKNIMKNKYLSMHIKGKFFNTCISPCMMYDCEIWALTDKHREILANTQSAMEINMLGV